MFLSILVGALAALAVLMLLMAFLRSVRTLPSLCHLVYLQGDAADTEQLIRASFRRQRDGIYTGKLIFIDGGLEPEAQVTAQLLLTAEDAAVLCAPSQASEYVMWEIENFGTGTD